LVALGAGLWGTESAWRIPLGRVFASDVLVFWEHVVLVLCAIPLVVPRLGELRRVSWRALAWLVFSGVAGSAVGALLFTEALKRGNATIAGVVLNVQPILSTTAACVLFGDRLARGFYQWAALAVVSGMVLVGLVPWHSPGLDAGAIFALLCALFWGLSTVAGRGIMVEMSLPLASGLRVMIGLVSMVGILAINGHLSGEALWPAAAAADQAHVIVWTILLATLSGGVPLLIYFKGLELTRASTAGYFEMMQTLVHALITWLFFGQALTWWQVCAALALLAAVTMVQRAQEQTALTSEPSPPTGA